MDDAEHPIAASRSNWAAMCAAVAPNRAVSIRAWRHWRVQAEATPPPATRANAAPREAFRWSSPWPRLTWVWPLAPVPLALARYVAHTTRA